MGETLPMPEESRVFEAIGNLKASILDLAGQIGRMVEATENRFQRLEDRIDHTANTVKTDLDRTAQTVKADLNRQAEIVRADTITALGSLQGQITDHDKFIRDQQKRIDEASGAVGMLRWLVGTIIAALAGLAGLLGVHISKHG